MIDDDHGARSAAYASLVTALVGVRSDPATQRFDAELAAAEAAGDIEPTVARTLRWWQRESVRAVEDLLAGVLPVLLTSLADAERAATDSVAASAVAWATATGSESGHPLPPPDPGPADRASADPGRSSGSGASGIPPHPPVDPGGAPYLRPVDGGSAAPPPSAAPPLRPGFAPAPGGPPAAPPVPPSAVRPPGAVADDSRRRGAPPRRLLVAGLTVLPDDGSTPRSAAGRDRSQTASTTHDDVPGAPG